MGCGLRKLGDPDDSSPGKIFSTLKRPQVETKTDLAYEYVLLDFSLQASSNPEVIKINSIVEIVPKVEEYYVKGYVVGAIHPVLQAAGPRRHLPASHLYRVVLLRSRASPKHTAAAGRHRRPRLVMEECPLTDQTQMSDVAKEHIEKINAAARRGMKFVGFVSQPQALPKCCNGAGHEEDTDSPRHSPERSCWSEGESGQSSESGVEEKPRPDGGGQGPGEGHGSLTSPKPRKGLGDKLYAVFNVFGEDSPAWTYQEGVLAMKVTRKGPVVSALDADWLELTTFYYKQGLSLIDSFVCWDTSKGDHSPTSLEGFFIYEEEGSGVPGSNRKGNDAIVVEQWTVIEGSEIKADYGPLLHTLAEFGWLLTSVLPTPLLRRDSEGNLATKQVVFLQRPAAWTSATQAPDRRSGRPVKGEDRGRAGSGHTGPDAGVSQAPKGSSPRAEALPSRECRASQAALGPGGSFSGLRELDEGQFEQEDGATQVTCI